MQVASLTKSANTGISQYHPSISTDSPVITVNGDTGSAVLTFLGGIPGSTVNFSVSGDGTLSAAAATVDGAGNASVRVYGKTPYASSPVVTVSTAGTVAQQKFTVRRSYQVNGSPYQSVRCNEGNNVEYNALEIRPSLPAAASAYASIQADFYIDGKVDDEFRFYLNGAVIGTAMFAWDAYWPRNRCDVSHLYRGQRTLSGIRLSGAGDVLAIHSYSAAPPSATVIYETWIRVTTVSK